MSDCLYENIIEFNTPVGYFAIYDGNKKIEFSVRAVVEDYIYEIPKCVYKQDSKCIETINIDKSYVIEVDKSILTTEKVYEIRFSKGKWCYLDGDDKSETYGANIDGYIVGICRFDENEPEKAEQLINKSYYKNMKFNEAYFEDYIIYNKKDCNGFKFKVVDYEKEKIIFLVA